MQPPVPEVMQTQALEDLEQLRGVMWRHHPVLGDSDVGSGSEGLLEQYVLASANS